MVQRRETYAGLGLEDRVDTHDSGSRSWDDPVGQFSVSAEENMTGQLSNGNIIGRLLELQNLLVHAHRLVVIDDIWVQAASCGVGFCTNAPKYCAHVK